MEGPQLLFIKITNAKNTKVLNGTDGALVCTVHVDGNDYHPIDVVLRRPKSDHGLQKNSLVFQLPSVSNKFDISFMKQKSNSKQQQKTDGDNNTPTTTTTSNGPTILAKSSIVLQYSSLPMSLPRRSSYNSLSIVNQQQSSISSLPTPSPPQSPRSTSSSPKLSQSGNNIVATPPSPIMIGSGTPPTSSSSVPIPIGGGLSSSNNNLSASSTSSNGGVIGNGTPGLSGSPQLYGVAMPPPYSLSVPSSPSGMDSPPFVSYQNGQRIQTSPVPIFASNSTSSPTLATINNSEQTEMDNGRIESSLKWYKLQLPGSTGASTTAAAAATTTTPIALNSSHIVPSTSMSSFTNMIDDESTYTTDDPEIQLQISYEVTNLPYLIRLKATHKEMLDHIITPKLSLVHAMCDAVDITAAQVIAKSLVDVFHSHHKLLHLLKSFLKKEVAACHDPGTLFRSNSVAMKMVVAYGHKTAQHYLQQTLTPLVVDLCNSPLPLEVDPIKLPAGEDPEVNQRNLRIVSQKFFDRIVQSIDQCPKSIAEVCYYFKKIVSRKFPNHWKAAVGGFVFLRLFCPACVSPENAGIVSAGRVGISERRALVLVAKCLQNLSNQATFNQPYMENVNDFITDNVQALDEFFTKLAARPTEDHTIDGMMVSEESLHDGIIYLQQFIDKNTEKVQRAYESNVAKSSANGANNNNSAKWEQIIASVEASKKAGLSAPPISNHLLNGSKQRSNSAGANGGSKELKNKQRSNSDNNATPKWSSLTKNLKIAKQTVITPTLNVISNVANKTEEEVKVINIDSEWRSEPRPAHVVIQQLLKTLIVICKNNKLSDAQSIKFNGQPLNWALVQQAPEFLQFGRDVCELQVVTFDNMSPEYIAAFFINAFNLLVLHLHFIVGPPNSDMRRKSYQLHKYNIAGCLYSLTDIQHGILRNNPKNSLTRVRQIRSGDKRRQFVIPLDPRYHFVLFAVNVTLPCLRIMVAEMLVEDLHRAGEEFCSSKVDICLKKKEISLPKLFSQFGTDFGKSRSEMLKWLFQFLTHTKRTELLDLLEKPSYICLYRSESWNPVTYKTKFILDSLSKSPSLEQQYQQQNYEHQQPITNLQLSPDVIVEASNSPPSSATSSPHLTSLPQSPRIVTIIESSPLPQDRPRDVSPPTPTTTNNDTTVVAEEENTVTITADSTQTTPISSPNTVSNTATTTPSSPSPSTQTPPTTANTSTQPIPAMKLSSNSAFDKEKVLRRKSRSLTHVNRSSPGVKKDSTALTLINSLRMSAQSSTKSILASLNDVIKRIAESIDIKYVSGVLNILKRATRQLSFNEWQKSSTMSAVSGTQGDKPSLSIKPQAQLFSNHQVHCLTPNSLSLYAPTFQELYALTLSIEKETIKFLDFMDIASFSQSNDISELLADVADQISTSLRDHDSKYDPLLSVKETLESTVIYFINTVTTKLQQNNNTNNNNNTNTNNVQLNQQTNTTTPTTTTSNGINIPLRGSGVIDVDIKLVTVLYELILDGKQLPGKRDHNVISKLQELSDNIHKVNNMAELSPIMSKIERIGRMISIIEEQSNNNRFSPRQSPR